MSRPISLRLSDEVRERLHQESRLTGSPVGSLAASLIDEGLRMRHFEGIVFRDGPAGRRAGLARGPDVWEIVRDLKRERVSTRPRVELVIEETGLTEEAIMIASDYYAVYPEEIDARIALDDEAWEEMRVVVRGPERQLAQV